MEFLSEKWLWAKDQLHVALRVKNAFSGLLFRKQKGTRGFQWQEDVTVIAIICKTLSQFFKILSFSQNIWGNVYYVHEINLISRGTLIKAFYLPSETT